MSNSTNGKNGSNGSGSGPELFDDFVVPEGLEDFSGKDAKHSLLGNLNVMDQLTIKGEYFETDGSSDGSNGQYRKRPSGYEHPLWNLGWTDGRLGQPRETNEALLLAHGKFRRDRKAELTEETVSLNRAKLADLRERTDRFRQKLADATTRYQDVMKDRIGRYHEFSYSLAIFYLAVGFILFLSDVPLTLKLVARGFDLKTEVTDSKSQKVLFGVDDLLTRTGDVVSQLWEPLALALGIALAGVFIKLFLDDVIFGSATSSRPKKITLTLVTIMLILVGTIGGLGVFRARIQNNLQSSRYLTDQKNLEERLKKQGLPEPQIKEMVSQLPKAGEESTLAILTFIALTLTLPLVAGACFSGGWRRLKDTQRYRQSKREVSKLESKLKAESDELHVAEAKIDSGEKWLERSAKDWNIVDPETEQELSLYRHGYFRGLSLPETIDHGLSLHSRAQRSAERIVAKRLRQRTWEDLARET